LKIERFGYGRDRRKTVKKEFLEILARLAGKWF